MIVTYLVKASLLLLFYRLFKICRPTRFLIYGGAAVITLLTVPYATMAAYRIGHCVATEALTARICNAHLLTTTQTIFSSLNVASDFYILAIPILRVRALQVSTRTRWRLYVPFLTGFWFDFLLPRT